MQYNLKKNNVWINIVKGSCTNWIAAHFQVKNQKKENNDRSKTPELYRFGTFMAHCFSIVETKKHLSAPERAVPS